MTTEELKIVISADPDDAIRDLNTVKNSVKDLGNTSNKVNLGDSFSSGTNAARQLSDQVSQLRTSGFLGLISSVATWRASSKAAMVAQQTAMVAQQTAINASKSRITELQKEYKELIKLVKEYKDQNSAVYTVDGEEWEGPEEANKKSGWAFNEAHKIQQELNDETAKYNKLIQQAGQTGESAFLGLSAAAKTVAATVAVAAAAVAALVAAVKTGFSTAQRLTASFYEAQKIGMQHSSYEEWAYVMGQVGVEADKLSDFIKSLSAAQNDLRDGSEGMVKAFEALGLSAAEAANMTQEQLFTETIKRLQQMENQVERTGIAYRIFGEDDAAQLTNILNLNNQEMERMINNFYLLGGSASDSAIQKSRTLSAAVSNLKLAWQGFTNTIGEAVMPALTAIVNALTKAVVAINMFLRAVFGFSIVSKGSKTSIEGASVSMDGYGDSMKKATAAAEQLKRTTQGFDELNVMSNPKTGGGGSGDDYGGGSGGTIDIPSMDFEGLTQDLGLDKMAKWFEENAEAIQKWTTIVVAATTAWKIFKTAVFLVTGEKIGFFATLGSAIKGLIGAFPKLAGWLGTVIALVKEGNSIWSVLGVAFPKLAAVISKVGTALAAAAKAVAAFVGGLSAGAIAIIVAIVAAIASAVYFLWKNWDGVVQATKDWIGTNIMPYIEELGATFGTLWEAIVSVWDALVGVATAIWDALPEGVKEFFIDVAEGIANAWNAVVEFFRNIDWNAIWQGFLTVIEWIGGFVVGVLGGVIGGAISALLNLIEGAVQIITGIVQIVAGIVSGLINLIVALFTGDFSKALDSVKMIWEGIKNVFLGAVDAVIGTVWAFVKGIIDWFVELWDVLVGHSIVPDMIEAIIDWFFKLPGQLFGMMADFVKGIIDWFINLATNAGKWAGEMWNKVKAPFSGVGAWFKNIFQGAWDGIKSIWNGVGTFFTNVWNTIKGIFSKVGTSIAEGVTGAVKGAINSVLSSVVNKINTFIGWINGAVDLINKIPGVSIGKIGKLSVPQLATGGIVTKSTLANIGERGREAVLPLENNTGWMDKLADRIAARNSSPSKIVLMLDGRELGWATINNINAITKQTGGIQLLV